MSKWIFSLFGGKCKANKCANFAVGLKYRTRDHERKKMTQNNMEGGRSNDIDTQQ